MENDGTTQRTEPFRQPFLFYALSSPCTNHSDIELCLKFPQIVVGVDADGSHVFWFQALVLHSLVVSLNHPSADVESCDGLRVCCEVLRNEAFLLH